jgi:hypothetical protein
MKPHMIWAKHLEGTSASYTIGNPDNTIVEGCNMPAKGQHHYLQIDYVMLDVTNDSFGSEGGDEEVTMSIVTNN